MADLTKPKLVKRTPIFSPFFLARDPAPISQLVSTMGWKTSVAILLFLLVLHPPQLPARRRKGCAAIKDFDKLLQRTVELEVAEDSVAMEECLASGTSRFPERYEGWLRLGERLKTSGRADEAAENFRAGLRSLRGEDAQVIPALRFWFQRFAVGYTREW